jgi:hypothetical protein
MSIGIAVGVESVDSCLRYEPKAVCVTISIKLLRPPSSQCLSYTSSHSSLGINLDVPMSPVETEYYDLVSVHWTITWFSAVLIPLFQSSVCR